jgi:hypothetical protein
MVGVARDCGDIARCYSRDVARYADTGVFKAKETGATETV